VVGLDSLIFINVFNGDSLYNETSITSIFMLFCVYFETATNIILSKIKYVPAILISALGYTICPCSGRNT